MCEANTSPGFLVSGGGIVLWLPIWWIRIRIRELVWLGTVQLLAGVVLLFCKSATGFHLHLRFILMISK